MGVFFLLLLGFICLGERTSKNSLSLSVWRIIMLIFDKVSMQTNLERFLDCVTPVVPSHLLPKNDMMNLNSLWHPWERENLNYFTLGDLWNCYDEWSAYGAGVPV